jgi:hypothetical protein
MEGPARNRAEGGSAHWNWSIGVLGLLAMLGWQTWLALGLFGPDDPWRTLQDDRPVISGSHPQHLYLGTQGAKALSSSGCICVYDPAFQLGYPKTPIFNGSRLAEVALFLGGGDYNPAAYKIGLFVICLLVPLLLMLACFGAGLSGFASLLATATGILLFWGTSGREAIEAGDFDFLVASLGMLAHAAMLIRFHRVPGVLSWLFMWLTAAIVWFSQPLVYPLTLPMLLFFYLWVGAKHSSFTWHGALLLAQVLAVVVNLPWLIDWVNYWWLRSPLPASASMLPHRTLQTLWDAPLWGGPADRILAVFVLGSATVGVVLLHYQQRLAARILSLGNTLLLVLAFLGISWEPIGQLGTSVLFLPALLFAALPAAHAWTWTAAYLWKNGFGSRLALAGLVGVAAFLGYRYHEELTPLTERALLTKPLQIGLGARRNDIVKKIVDHTGTDARILWEDRPLSRQAPHWSALLPLLTGRAFLGGLDPDGFIEHSSVSIIDGALEGMPISTWSDEALDDYCRRYNVGWIVAWSPAVLKRFQEWDGAVQIVDVEDDVQGYMFLVKHARRDYTLKGTAHLIHADWHHITLADVVPENGTVVLSLHYQAGMVASPSRVQIEREPCAHDPIGFIRLRVAGPVSRLTLTWGNR